MRTGPKKAAGAGFTLVELLVVILIVILLTAATLPAVLPALSERRVSEAALMVQAALAGARDAAIRANEPRGIRLLSDPTLNGPFPQRFAASRIISIQQGPDYSEGLVTVKMPTPAEPRLRIVESKAMVIPSLGTTVPNPPTSWYWNVRQGDKIRLAGSGQVYTIVGPMVARGAANPERYINNGPPATYVPFNQSAGGSAPEFLFVVNGQDDNGNGFVDESCDGIDNDGDGVTDPGFDGIDNDGDGKIDNGAEVFFHNSTTFPGPVWAGNGSASPGGEYDGIFTVNGINPPPPFRMLQMESFVGPQFQNSGGDGLDNDGNGVIDDLGEFGNGDPFMNGKDDDGDGVIDETGETSFSNQPYTILRTRPVVAEGAREIALPSGIVIDMTTTNPLLPQASERSRLPIDPLTGYVDIMVAPNGQVVPPPSLAIPTVSGANTFAGSVMPFYHFWLTDRSDLVDPLWGVSGTPPAPNPNPNPPFVNLLPLPGNQPGDLKADRRLVTLTTRTGQIVTNPIENFDPKNINVPFLDAEAGVRDQP
jgi:type II secretory pathway pseudopilin PulG